MAVSALSAEESARERDDYLGIVNLSVEAGPRDAYEYRLGAFHAITGARWAAAADPGDPVVVELLRTAGQLGAAVMTSTVSDTAVALPIRGRRQEVPPGLPAASLTAQQWGEALWAATAASDAPSAVRLARLESTVDAPGAPAGEVELARAVAAWWRGDRAGPHLIQALQDSDPDAATGAESDRRLDQTTPAVAVFRHLLADDDAALAASVVAAGEAHARFWSERSRRTKAGRALSLPLSGLVRLSVEAGRFAGEPPAGVPKAVVAPQPTALTLCPVCASPFDEVQATCVWCGTDLTADAPLEQRLDAFLEEQAGPCPVCARPNRVTALRCWNCSSSLSG
jgi:hypothetical protein